MATTGTIPSSVLIVGSGVFGLSTAYALAQRDAFRNTSITLLERLDFPAPDAASIDSSRIIRPDYADPAYAALMAEAHPHWRGDFGADGRYSEAGLCLVQDSGDESGDNAAHYYLIKALENVKSKLGLRVGRREESGQVELLETPEDVARVTASMGGDCGRRGYVNWTSGWADAEAGMRYMRKLVKRTGRVDFRTAEVETLHYGQDRVEAVELVGGEPLRADLVVLATGAWMQKLVDLRGIASATGQVLAYIDITQEEQDRLGGNPTLFDTPVGDWLISYHPTYRNLFVATGGSGHAYKFLPVVGESIVDVVMGEERDELGAELGKKWKWPAQRREEDQVWTDDWRGGVKGMILDEELAKGEVAAPRSRL
ncbi:hypothetical protein LTR48_003899 [Friedmanniomyces endolithicus]|uniref:FAD dependent oxidoreductase domain-containing protein n=1 Tax=Rachicladosporium monterosium TaxID=1507873 RepID=A0ABR0L5J5_9PEZI|nr:hypothetical protein LTR48_003899 [Friedmanniomyces endolithicus]KAK5143849.1 hypothetical protein LTR32_004103 [Rachicladosporium monterosium]